MISTGVKRGRIVRVLDRTTGSEGVGATTGATTDVASAGATTDADVGASVGSGEACVDGAGSEVHKRSVGGRRSALRRGRRCVPSPIHRLRPRPATTGASMQFRGKTACVSIRSISQASHKTSRSEFKKHKIRRLPCRWHDMSTAHSMDKLWADRVSVTPNAYLHATFQSSMLTFQLPKR